MRKKQHHAEVILLYSWVPQCCLYQCNVVLGQWKVTAAYCSIRQKCINLTALVSVTTVARDNMPVRCLHRSPSNNSAKKLHGQHNLQQPRRCSNIYQATAWGWQISGAEEQRSCLKAFLHWLSSSTFWAAIVGQSHSVHPTYRYISRHSTSLSTSP